MEKAAGESKETLESAALVSLRSARCEHKNAEEDLTVGQIRLCNHHSPKDFYQEGTRGLFTPIVHLLWSESVDELADSVPLV